MGLVRRLHVTQVVLVRLVGQLAAAGLDAEHLLTEALVDTSGQCLETISHACFFIAWLSCWFGESCSAVE